MEEKNYTEVPMSIETLNEYLPKIGWSISGADTNMWLYNGYGKRTKFRMIGTERLEIRNGNIFGESEKSYDTNGDFCICFKDSVIRYYDEDSPYIALRPKNGETMFVNLYYREK